MDVYHPAGINTDDYAGGTGAFTYNYANDQEAAGLWQARLRHGRHPVQPHVGPTGQRVLPAPLRDRHRPYAGIPQGLRYFDATAAHEVPIVLQDRQLKPDGTLAYPPGVSPLPSELGLRVVRRRCRGERHRVAEVDGQAGPVPGPAAERLECPLLPASDAGREDHHGTDSDLPDRC